MTEQWNKAIGRVMVVPDELEITVDPETPIFNRLFAQRFPLRLVFGNDHVAANIEALQREIAKGYAGGPIDETRFAGETS